MNSDVLGVRLGLTNDSAQRFRGLEGRFVHADEALLRRTELAVDSITTELESYIRAEFKKGTDKEGISHDKTGYSLSTLEAHTFGMEGRITGGGGLAFVEFGSEPHQITGNPLKFFSEEYGWTTAYTVDHPGYAGDDYVGRAVQDTNPEYELSRLARAWEMEIFREGEYGLNVGQVN